MYFEPQPYAALKIIEIKKEKLIIWYKFVKSICEEILRFYYS